MTPQGPTQYIKCIVREMKLSSPKDFLGGRITILDEILEQRKLNVTLDSGLDSVTY